MTPSVLLFGEKFVRGWGGGKWCKPSYIFKILRLPGSSAMDHSRDVKNVEIPLVSIDKACKDTNNTPNVDKKFI